MPIISHTITSTEQPDGRISYILRLYDQDATEYMSSGLAPAGFNLSALVDARTAEWDVQLAESEFQSIVGL